MQKLFLTVLLATSFALANSYEDKFFNPQNPSLNAQEKAGINIYKKWSSDNKKDTIRPFQGQNGGIVFVYGASQPSIICAVLQVCDIALEAGEKINAINIGDNARWSMEPAITGTGSDQTVHIILKPKDVNLNTSLIVSTDRRTYHMRLKSHRTEYMPLISFEYPENAMAKFQRIQAAEAVTAYRETLPNSNEKISDLNFDYVVSGSAPWKPERVYNDGQQTIFMMPKNFAQNEAPALLIVRGNEQVMVNYRVIDNKYIIDSIFDRAVLIAGVGFGQTRVTITKKGGQ